VIELLIYTVGIVLAFYMAWCLGANDAANPTECAVGAGVVSMRRALILFAAFTALGAILLGPFVMKTVDRGLIPRDRLSLEMVAVGSFTAVLSASLWVTFSSWKGMPVSTTHSTIGGILGFGLTACSSMINWGQLSIVIMSLVLSPVLSLLLASGLFYLLRSYFRRVRKERSNLIVISSLIYLLCFATSISIFGEILKWNVEGVILGGLLVALAISAISVHIFKRIYGKFESEQSLSYLLIIALCFSAFSFGANDMANATGVFVTPTQKLMGGPPALWIMFLLAALGAVGIAIGGFTWGYRVINTSAYQITRLDPLSGAAAEYSNAITVFLFTVVPGLLTGFGVPISTTHSSIGSIIGVGLAMKGLKGVSMRTTGRILAFWILTIPAVALISMVLFWLFSHMVVIT
jgi:PiT family inorganic phosphate transporter